MTTPRTAGRDRAAVSAAVLAFASAAVTLFWLLGGTLGLDTVGGEFERLARERSAAALVLAVVVVVAKLAAGVLALVLGDPRPRRGHPRHPLHVAGLVGGVLLAVYGGVLVLVGLLVLAGVVDGPRDTYALRWHVFLWDPWFLVWGVALALAGRAALRRERP